MRIPIPRFGRLLRSLEQHLASQAEEREGKAIAAHMATVNTPLGKHAGWRKGHSEPMPYRLHIAVAFASLASALFSMYWWYP